MQALTLPARHGWRWLADGFRLFRKNHGMLAFLVVSYWLLMAVLNLIPWLGTAVTILCIPAFSVSLMNACRNIERAAPLSPQILFSGFQSNLPALLTLGAVYLVATLCILGISSLADDGVLLRLMMAGEKPTPEAIADGRFVLASQIALLLLCPLMMAYWYAPMLAAWHRFSPGKALFFSFVACLRNWRAFLVYSLAVAFVCMLAPVFLLGLLAVLLQESSALVSGLVVVGTILVIAPTVFASFYVSFRDVFVTGSDA
ncbi:MAG TPA: BPSS1780 family membrane protein [Accumulibacter sp.]|uniref:BPSS1780 family membrane protein n=2 Tax=Accumulibacter sp. TaxID=2053492 RepID=UPI002C20A361|nr:BPSS1780 family membrane protein [Accumulibacter sp.]HNJ51987.1 BPSS1780 family membrane protein [Accumulibacter sp.]